MTRPDEHTTDLTPEEARQRLRDASGARLASVRDRQVHGWATAGFGVVIGAYVALSRLARDHEPWPVVVLLCYAVLFGLLAWWQTGAARTVPRHARRLSWLGLGGSVALMLIAITGLNVLRADAELDGGSDLSTHPLLVLATAVVVATPMLVAGHRIRHDR